MSIEGVWFLSPRPSSKGVPGGRERAVMIARPNTWTSAYTGRERGEGVML